MQSKLWGFLSVVHFLEFAKYFSYRSKTTPGRQENGELIHLFFRLENVSALFTKYFTIITEFDIKLQRGLSTPILSGYAPCLKT